MRFRRRNDASEDGVRLWIAMVTPLLGVGRRLLLENLNANNLASKRFGQLNTTLKMICPSRGTPAETHNAEKTTP